MMARQPTRTPIRALTLAELDMAYSGTKVKSVKRGEGAAPPNLSIKKQPSRTPSRALTLAELAELDMASTKKKEIPAAGRGWTGHPKLAFSTAKSSTQQFPGLMPPPSRNFITSMKKTSKPGASAQKTYLSTSKKQVQSRKNDHTIVRRALNFIATSQMEEIQVVHPNSKKTRQKSAQSSHQSEKSTLKEVPAPVPSCTSTNDKSQIKPPQLMNNDNKQLTVPLPKACTYDLRSRTSAAVPSDTALTQMFTQYRNINESFDVSLRDEPSPEITVTDKSLFEPLQKPCVTSLDSPLYDHLSDLMCKTELTSNQSNIEKNIEEIQSKVHKNAEEIKKQMEFLNHISDEISKHKENLTSCMENNEQILKLTTCLLEVMKNDKSQTNISAKKIKQTIDSIPMSFPNSVVSKNVVSRPLLEKLRRESLFFYVGDSLLNDKKNIDNNISNGIVKSPNLQSKAKNLLNSSKKENISPSPKVINSARKKKLTKSNSQLLKPDLRKSVLRSALEIKQSVFEDPVSPRTTKSQQMFKSLKESINFLKTPVGKGKKTPASRLEYETPNTKSRNITTNNIKKQLESLYDSE